MRGILRDNNGDMMIKNSQLQLGNIENDVVRTVMFSCPGELKHAPNIGADLVKMINEDTSDHSLFIRIKSMLIEEGLQITKISIEGDKLIIT